MKNSLKYLGLWQKKRNELPVDINPEADWLKMTSYLDELMPVSNSATPKKVSGLKALKLLPKLFIVFSAAAMIYGGVHFYLSKKHKQPRVNMLHKAGMVIRDSTINDSIAVKNDSAASNHDTDSLLLLKSEEASGRNSLTSDSVKVNSNHTKTKADLPSSNSKKMGASVLSNTVKRVDLKARMPRKKYSAALSYSNKLNFGKISLLASIQNNASVVQRKKEYNNSGGAKTNRSGRQKRDYKLLATSNKINDAASKNNRFGNNLQPDEESTSPMANKNASGFVNKPDSLSTTKQVAPAVAATDKAKSETTLVNVRAAKIKKTKVPGKLTSNIDWGILLGVNSSGSFTPSKQNANFYGSAPVDFYLGLFATYYLNNRWAINPQVRLFSPQNVINSYTRANNSKVDSGQRLTVTSSRKIYAVNVPIYLVYKATSAISLKLGPVVNFPVKQINTRSVLTPASISADSAYYSRITDTVNATKYLKKVNFGVSGGASIQYKRFIFEATYFKTLSGYKISSDLGTYKSNINTFQFTIEFKLNKGKQ